MTRFLVLPRSESLVGPEDPAVEGAVRALRLSEVYCPADCAWYHGARPLLRALGLGLFKGIEKQVEYFGGPLGARARSRSHPRVLIAGSADYAMFAVVYWIYGQEGCTPEITVIDQCEAPLALVRWYAERSGFAAETVATNVFAYAPSAPFDLICADAILGHFRAAERPALFKRWHNLLRTGAAAILTTRIRDAAPDEKISVSPKLAADLRTVALQAAGTLEEVLGISKDEIVRHVLCFAEKRRTYAVQSLDELLHQLNDAGFDVDEIADHEGGYVVISATAL